MKVPNKSRASHQRSAATDRLIGGGILGVVALMTLHMTKDPNAVPMVVAPVALFFGFPLKPAV